MLFPGAKIMRSKEAQFDLEGGNRKLVLRSETSGSTSVGLVSVGLPLGTQLWRVLLNSDLSSHFIHSWRSRVQYSPASQFMHSYPSKKGLSKGQLVMFLKVLARSVYYCTTSAIVWSPRIQLGLLRLVWKREGVNRRSVEQFAQTVSLIAFKYSLEFFKQVFTAKLLQFESNLSTLGVNQSQFLRASSTLLTTCFFWSSVRFLHALEDKFKSGINAMEALSSI